MGKIFCPIRHFAKIFTKNCYFVPLVSRFLEHSLFFLHPCAVQASKQLIGILFCFVKSAIFSRYGKWESPKTVFFTKQRNIGSTRYVERLHKREKSVTVQTNKKWTVQKNGFFGKLFAKMHIHEKQVLHADTRKGCITWVPSQLLFLEILGHTFMGNSFWKCAFLQKVSSTPIRFLTVLSIHYGFTLVCHSGMRSSLVFSLFFWKHYYFSDFQFSHKSRKSVFSETNRKCMIKKACLNDVWMWESCRY